MQCLRCCTFCVLWLPCAALLDALRFFGASGRRDFSARELTGEGESMDRGELQDTRLASQSFRDYQSFRSHRLDRRQGQAARKQVPLARRPPASNFCPRYPGGGWHAGNKEAELKPTDAPNGATWTWEDCARECAQRDACQYWTLQLKTGSCTMMSKRGRYHSSDYHVEGPRDPECLRAQPTGPIAGMYEVRYKGQLREWDMVVHCNSSVSHPGILTDKSEPRRSDFHVSASPSSQCIRRWPQSTVLIFNTHDSSKFECLQQDSMTKLRGSRFYASGQLFGDVEYRLTKTFTCGFEQADGSNESVLVESIDDQGPELEEEQEEDSQDAQSELITDVADVDVAAERAEQPAAGADVDAEAFPAEGWSKDEATDASEMPPAVAPFAPRAPAAAPAPPPALTPLSPLAAVPEDQLKEQAPAADNASSQQRQQAVATAVVNSTAPGNETVPEAAAAGEKRADASIGNASDAAPAPPAAAATEKKDEAAAAPANASRESTLCASWCRGHTDEWAMKCTFKGCGACEACAAKAPTAAVAAANETGTVALKESASKKGAAMEEEKEEEEAEEGQRAEASEGEDAHAEEAQGEAEQVPGEDEDEDGRRARKRGAGAGGRRRAPRARRGAAREEGDGVPDEEEGQEEGEGGEKEDEGDDRPSKRQGRRGQEQEAEDGEEEVRPSPVRLALQRALESARSGSSRRDASQQLLGRHGHRSAAPTVHQGESFIEHLDKMLVSGLARISNALDGHKQRIKDLAGELDVSAELRGSDRSQEPLVAFLQDGLPEIERRRLDLEAVIDDTLEKMKRALANVGHTEVAPELDECMEANRQAGTLSTWFFGLGSADAAAPAGEAPLAPQDQILAMDAACAQLKPAEDALASQFRTTFRTLTQNLRLSKAVAEVPEFQQQLDDFQQRVLQKATAIAWSLHSGSMDLTKLIRGWSAHAAETSEPSESSEPASSADSAD